MIFPPFPFGPTFYRRPFIPYRPNIENTQNDNKKSPYNYCSDKEKSCRNAYFPNQIMTNSSNKISNNEINTNYTESRYINDDFVDFFGLKLYSDDLLLIGLLFFLYEENVKDTYLYMALILLLLS